MNSPNSFENIFYNIICDYFETFPVETPIIPDYRIVEDIASEYLSLRPDVLEKASTNIKSLSAYNGFAVPPQKVGGTFTVLINKVVLLDNIQNERMDWVGTLVHETTHVQDFSEYAQIVGATEYEEVLRIDLHGMFNLWTEIHARAKGYYFTRKYTLGDEGMHSDKMLVDITNRELPAQMNNLYKQYHATQNGYEQAYLVAQYIGRLYTLQRLYPKDLTDGWVRNHFDVNNWIADWFFFFKEYPTLKAAIAHFDKMKKILGQNFTGI